MKVRQKTLIILSPGFPKDEADSTCLPAQQLLVRSITQTFPKLNIIVLSFEYPLTTTPYRWYGTLVHPFNGWKKTKLSKLLAWYSIWRKLDQIRKQNHIVGILSFWCGQCALIGKYYARLHAITHFCWILGQDARKDNRFIRWIRPHGEELIAISDFLVQEFSANHGVHPRHLIPNGVDMSFSFSSILDRDIDVLGVGSLIALKQYDLFIRLTGELTKSFPSIKANICGRGPEKEKLQSLIRELNLDNNLVMTDQLEHPQILRLMQRTRVFLHPSSYEGFSTVCLEALAAGAHVISFCKAMDRPIAHWHIVATQEAMVEKLKRILEDPATEFQAVAPYDMRENALAMMKLFQYSE
jgi:glycosyltransferase involved in cell wall biosynthesis